LIKRIKQFHPKALLNSENFRNYIDNFESEILRGISTLSILSIIYRNLESGIYGYNLAKELRKETNNLLFIEEGTLYPILRKLKKDGIVDTIRREVGGRIRNYNFITPEGIKVFNYLAGYYTKLTEAMQSIINFKIDLSENQFFYCPNCANRIEKHIEKSKICEVCGLNVENFNDKRISKK